jgi:hypothetical protein
MATDIGPFTHIHVHNAFGIGPSTYIMSSELDHPRLKCLPNWTIHVHAVFRIGPSTSKMSPELDHPRLKCHQNWTIHVHTVFRIRPATYTMSSEVTGSNHVVEADIVMGYLSADSDLDVRDVYVTRGWSGRVHVLSFNAAVRVLTSTTGNYECYVIALTLASQEIQVSLVCKSHLVYPIQSRTYTHTHSCK